MAIEIELLAAADGIVIAADQQDAYAQFFNDDGLCLVERARLGAG